jgi:hypothetical protein
MERTKVKSSHVAAVGFDPQSRRLHVEFHNGKVYEYRGVDQHFHDALMNGSVGENFHTYIKPHFKGTKI